MVSKQLIMSSILLIFTLITLFSSNLGTMPHYTNLVYKKCRNETHIPHNLVSSILETLVEKSTKSKFYQTSTGDDTFAVSGMFQCRQDLTNENCHNCIVNSITKLSCASGFLPRVQLRGCHMSLNSEPEPEDGRIDNRVLIGVQKDYLQHTKCGERRSWFEGLEEVRDTTFEMVAKCVTSSGTRYCEMKHEGMYAMGQCEGSLGECECGGCVSNAFQVAQDECWGSDSGEVYSEKCFVSFSDDKPNDGSRGNYSQGNHVGGGSAKVAAIVVGIGVAIALLSTLCYCIKSSRRKRDG